MIDLVCSYVSGENEWPMRLLVEACHAGERMAREYEVGHEGDELMAVANSCLLVERVLGQEWRIVGIEVPRDLELVLDKLRRASDATGTLVGFEVRGLPVEIG